MGTAAAGVLNVRAWPIEPERICQVQAPSTCFVCLANDPSSLDVDWNCVGSGSLAAMGVFEDGFKVGMEVSPLSLILAALHASAARFVRTLHVRGSAVRGRARANVT